MPSCRLPAPLGPAPQVCPGVPTGHRAGLPAGRYVITSTRPLLPARELCCSSREETQAQHPHPGAARTPLSSARAARQSLCGGRQDGCGQVSDVGTALPPTRCCPGRGLRLTLRKGVGCAQCLSLQVPSRGAPGGGGCWNRCHPCARFRAVKRLLEAGLREPGVGCPSPAPRGCVPALRL